MEAAMQSSVRIW